MVSRKAVIRGGIALLGLGTLALTGSPAHVRRAAASILGAGSTFDLPFFNRAFPVYSKRNSGVSVNYQGIGSGGGIQQFTANTVDFGASDVPMNSTELAAARKTGSAVVQIPIALGGVAIAYNLPAIGNHVLKLDGTTLANIFLGKISTWDDPAIQRLNPSLKLPALSILPRASFGVQRHHVHHHQLPEAVSSTWNSQIGMGKIVQWPGNSVGGKGNPGVAAAVKQHAGAIGYVELAYALDNHIPFAKIKNKAGAYLFPAQGSVKQAASRFPDVSYKNFSIVNAPGKASYPIAGYSWVLLRQHPRRNAADLVKLMRWTVTTGQTYASQLHYVPLPDNVRQQALQALNGIK